MGLPTAHAHGMGGQSCVCKRIQETKQSLESILRPLERRVPRSVSCTSAACSIALLAKRSSLMCTLPM